MSLWESVPVTKTVLPMHSKELCNTGKHARHTSFAAVTQTRYHENSLVLTVVTHTSFATAVGELIRSVHYSKSVGFRFTVTLQSSYVRSSVWHSWNP